MTTLSASQLTKLASRQPSSLTEDEKIVFAYLESKVHHNVKGLTGEARIVYEAAVDHIGLQVKTIERKPL